MLSLLFNSVFEFRLSSRSPSSAFHSLIMLSFSLRTLNILQAFFSASLSSHLIDTFLAVISKENGISPGIFEGIFPELFQQACDLLSIFTKMNHLCISVIFLPSEASMTAALS